MTTWGEKPPITNMSGSIHDKVVQDVKSRKELGLAKYGTILQAGNGRNALKDAYEEVLDLACYLRQKLEETNTPPLPPNLGGATVDIVVGGNAYYIPTVNLVFGEKYPKFQFYGYSNSGTIHYFNKEHITHVHKR